VIAPVQPAETPSTWAAIQLYALLDAGAVQTVQPEGLQAAKRWIGGAGAGLRWGAQGWRLQVEAARALNPGGTGLDGFITQKGDWRVHARLGLDF
jgi:hemolysin activation/secretion protein